MNDPQSEDWNDFFGEVRPSSRPSTPQPPPQPLHQSQAEEPELTEPASLAQPSGQDQVVESWPGDAAALLPSDSASSPADNLAPGFFSGAPDQKPASFDPLGVDGADLAAASGLESVVPETGHYSTSQYSTTQSSDSTVRSLDSSAQPSLGMGDPAPGAGEPAGDRGLGPIVPPQQLNAETQGYATAAANPIGDLSDPAADYFSATLPSANADVTERLQRQADDHYRRVGTAGVVPGQRSGSPSVVDGGLPGGSGSSGGVGGSGVPQVVVPGEPAVVDGGAPSGVAPLVAQSQPVAVVDPVEFTVGQAVPTQAGPTQAGPAQPVPTQAVPTQGTPGEGVPAQAVPRAGLPGEGHVGHGQPNGVTPGGGQPNGDVPNVAQPHGGQTPPGSLPSAQASQQGADVNPPVGTSSGPPDLSLGAATAAASTHRQGDDGVPSTSGNAGNAPGSSSTVGVDDGDGLAVVHSGSGQNGGDEVVGSAGVALDKPSHGDGVDRLEVVHDDSPKSSGQAAGSTPTGESPDTESADADDEGESKKPSRPAWLELLREIGIVVGAALLISLTIKTFLFQMFYIPSPSMSSTLAIGDRVVVSQLTPGLTDLKRGDIIVFKDPGNWLPPKNEVNVGPWTKASTTVLTFVGILPNDNGQHLIKRIVGMPGDVVTCCDGDGKIRINGEPVDEPYLNTGSLPSEVAFEIHVPKDGYWVLGDNRQQSKDSRYNMDQQGFGTVPHSEVVGRAVMIAWPAGRWTWLSNYQDTWARVPTPSSTPETAKTSAPAMPGEQNP